MLTRQRTILYLLEQIARPLTRTAFVKLVFLLRHETALQSAASFYDFMPYKYGPFSFTLYRELELLRQAGYVTLGDDEVALSELALDLPATAQQTGPIHREIKDLPPEVTSAADQIVSRYGRMTHSAMVSAVYRRYPWYAVNSELPQRDLVSLQRPKSPVPAIYTVGYEGKSVDAFFNELLSRGLDALIDVRANPISRKYGFSRLRLEQFCDRLGFEYRHLPSLGIPGTSRTGLGSQASYRRLLYRYERSMLPRQRAEVEELGRFMRRNPSVLMCVEANVGCCHRSKLAKALADRTGLEVVHL